MSAVNQTVYVGQEGRQLDEVGTDAVGSLFSVWVEDAELQRLLASYDPAVGTSPGVADARPVLRAILNAALAAQGGGA
jgi:hypothetical protein